MSELQQRNVRPRAGSLSPGGSPRQRSPAQPLSQVTWRAQVVTEECSFLSSDVPTCSPSQEEGRSECGMAFLPQERPTHSGTFSPTCPTLKALTCPRPKRSKLGKKVRKEGRKVFLQCLSLWGRISDSTGLFLYPTLFLCPTHLNKFALWRV